MLSCLTSLSFTALEISLIGWNHWRRKVTTSQRQYTGLYGFISRSVWTISSFILSVSWSFFAKKNHYLRVNTIECRQPSHMRAPVGHDWDSFRNIPQLWREVDRFVRCLWLVVEYVSISILFSFECNPGNCAFVESFLLPHMYVYTDELNSKCLRPRLCPIKTSRLLTVQNNI